MSNWENQVGENRVPQVLFVFIYAVLKAFLEVVKAFLKRSIFYGVRTVCEAPNGLLFVSAPRVRNAWTQRNRVTSVNSLISVNAESVTKLTLNCCDRLVILHQNCCKRKRVVLISPTPWLVLKKKISHHKPNGTCQTCPSRWGWVKDLPKNARPVCLTLSIIQK